MKTRKTISIFSLLVSLLLLFACTNRHKATMITDRTGKDKSRNYVVYEAVFLDQDEVLEIAEKIRGSEPAYKETIREFHVTTDFLPDQDHRDLYGQEVTVHITGYKAGEVITDDGTVTHNEAMKASLKSGNQRMQKYLQESQEGWHITLSYEDKSFYTNFMNFSDAQKTDYTLTGKLGAYLNGNFVSYDGNDVDTLISENPGPGK